MADAGLDTVGAVRAPSRKWTFGLIVISSLLFIVVLAVSAAFDSSIRVLHTFQALIYVAVILLARKMSPWGYGAGCFIAAFWNWANIAYTDFLRAGISETAQLLGTGHLERPDLFIAVFAAGAHFILIGACLAGYFQMPSRTRTELLKFLGGGCVAIAYFAGIILLFGQQFIWILKAFVGS